MGLSAHARSAGATGTEAGPRLAAGDVSLDPGGEALLLAVTLNGQDRGLAPFRLAQQMLWASPEALRRIGLAVAPSGESMLPLADLSGLAIDFRAESQELHLQAPVALLDAAVARINQEPGERVTATPATGAVLNYDLFASFDAAGTALNGLVELRGFAGNRRIESTALVQVNRYAGTTEAQLLRLDSALTMDWPQHRLSLRIGDTISAATAWSRATRLGGVQLGTDFSLQPYLDTAPAPAFTGSAALPSRAELFVDGIRRFGGEIPAGPFEIGAGPARIDGAGRAELVLTDILGRVTTQTFAIYETPRLLRPGLADWSVELGAVRRDFGLRSFGYTAAPAISATWRSGLSDRFTIESHAEGAPGFAQAGFGGVLLLGQAGVFTASLAGSSSSAGTGVQTSLGYSFSRRGFNLSASRQRASRAFTDLAAQDGHGPPRASDFLQIGWSSVRLGALGATLVRLRHGDEPERAYAGFSWSRNLGRRAALRLGANQNLHRRSDRSAFLSLSLSPGDGWHASAGVQQQGGRTGVDLVAERAVPGAGGFGWRTDLRQLPGETNAAARLTWLGALGEVQAGVSHFAGRNAGYLGFSGAIATLGGRLYAGRKVDDSFAVISTGGVPDLPVLLENNLIGRTDAQGELLVRGLVANQHNRLAIGIDELPQEMIVADDTIDAVPAARAGVHVAFPVRALRTVTVQVLDPAGRPLPPGTEIRRGGLTGGDLVIGFDGQLYLEDPLPGERLEADEACAFRLPDPLPPGVSAVAAPALCEPLW